VHDESQGTKPSLLRLMRPLVDKAVGRRRAELRGTSRGRRMRQVCQESRASYAELAEQCRWEADRTLDREVANSLRALADRYSQLSERQATGTSRL
jgi:hypothetical protein